MKILSAAQIREADQYTISHEPIAAIDLLERAAKACTARIQSLTPAGSSYIVICGRGNNGGDGLAIARMLAVSARQVSVYMADYTESGSPDFVRNLDRLKEYPSVLVSHIRSAGDLRLPAPDSTTIIDALLGTGINKPIQGLLASVIDAVNGSGLPVISVDVPSGLPVDSLMPQRWPVVRATVTLTFQQPKFTFMLPESGEYVGAFEVLDIGLDSSFIEGLESPYYFVQEADIAPLLLTRTKFAHKGDFGHALLIAGARGRMGAAVLAAHACLRSGTGLLTVHLPGLGYPIMQTALPEAMVSMDAGADHITALPELDPFNCIGIGPGIGKDPETARALKLLIQSTPCPLVLDADALNIISENKTWLGFLPPRSILTPHPKEFDRLTEKHTDSMERLRSAQALAHKHSIIIVLKGAHTATVMPDKSVWFNSTGNPALAKGGSGDVLTGIVTALISRGYAPREAAFTAVYLHGLAADLAVRHIHPESLMATDLISYLSHAFREMYAKQ